MGQGVPGSKIVGANGMCGPTPDRAPCICIFAPVAILPLQPKVAGVPLVNGQEHCGTHQGHDAQSYSLTTERCPSLCQGHEVEAMATAKGFEGA